MLKKIPFRIILRNKSQFFGIIFLVFLASFFYSLFSILISNIDMNYRNFVDRYKQEDFHFITTMPIDVGDLSKRFNLEIEERFIWDYEYGDKTLRIFNISSSINKPLISEGNIPSLGEIAVDPNFAQSNNLKIGDEIDILGKRFRISGFCFLPDYIYIIKNEQDFLPDALHFGIGVLNLEDLKPYISLGSYHYYMAKGNTDIDSLRKELALRYGLLRFQEKWDNFRIIVTEKKMESARPMSYVIASVMLIISSILLSIVLSRLIRSMHGEIGTLYALGYTHREIMNIYLRFPIIIWLLGSVPGILLGYLFADPFIKFYVSLITVPVVEKIFSYWNFALALILPGIFVMPTGYFSIRSLLGKSVVEIIRGEVEKGFKKRYKISFLDKLSFLRRLMIKQAILHPSREIILIFGIAFASFLILYGISARSSLYNLPEKTYRDILKYNYMYIFNSYQTENIYGDGERFNLTSVTIGESRANISVYGIEKDSRLINLTDMKGNRLELKGLIISRALADKFKLKVGDSIEFKDKVTGNIYNLKVENIADLYIGNSAYMNIDEFNNIFGQKDGTFIGLFSLDRLDIPKEKLLTVMDKNYIIKVFRDSASTIDQIIRFLSIASFLIALSITYVLSSLTITENRKPLAVFKILGYYDRELNFIFLGFNNISFIIGFLLGIPMFHYLMNLLMKNVMKDLDFSLELRSTPQDIIISFLILLFAFGLSKYFGRKRIYNISPSIILKEEME